MSHLLSFVLFSLCAFPAFAGNAVLLTSLELTKLNKLYLDSKFKQAFHGSGLNIVIQHDTSPKRLMEVLQDTETELLIWVSHAGEERSQSNGLSSKGVIIDHHGNDVKKFFSQPMKRLKFLGLVGCSAKTIIDGFRARGVYDQFTDLEIKSYDKPVRLYAAFEETLAASLEHLHKQTSNFQTIEEGHVTFNVSIEGSPRNSWLELGDYVLGFIDSSSKSVLTLDMPRSRWEQIQNKNINYVRDQSDKTPSELPKLHLQSEEGSWNLFTTKTGMAIGGKSNLYIFKK